MSSGEQIFAHMTFLQRDISLLVTYSGVKLSALVTEVPPRRHQNSFLFLPLNHVFTKN